MPQLGWSEEWSIGRACISGSNIKTSTHIIYLSPHREQPIQAGHHMRIPASSDMFTQSSSSLVAKGSKFTFVFLAIRLCCWPQKNAINIIKFIRLLALSSWMFSRCPFCRPLRHRGLVDLWQQQHRAICDLKGLASSFSASSKTDPMRRVHYGDSGGHWISIFWFGICVCPSVGENIPIN